MPPLFQANSSREANLSAAPGIANLGRIAYFKLARDDNRSRKKSRAALLLRPGLYFKLASEGESVNIR